MKNLSFHPFAIAVRAPRLQWKGSLSNGRWGSISVKSNAGPPAYLRIRRIAVLRLLRDAGPWRLHTFGIHTCWGTVKVIQNYFLDFEEATRNNYKEQWAICEAFAYFTPTGYGADKLNMIEDVDTLEDIVRLMCRLFLSMIARLEREKLLSKDSEILNLGLIVALFMEMPTLIDLDLDDESEPLGPKEDKKTWNPGKFWNHIYAYARKYDIKLEGARIPGQDHGCVQCQR
ncbi:hypothetical protein B0T16DRAFT_460214 [Cercophora newfieldiana]|uniref:Uncharacterized protein n=1 Tax=Cercophora newfieldiana TaxID=92897 RepID=A0AA39Y180_9PEZI|nr:hypothetical protein B0T16DRAFT_460214 [Cercophora newfieldiana]